MLGEVLSADSQIANVKGRADGVRGVTEAVARGGRILGPKLSYCVFFVSAALTQSFQKGSEAWQGKRLPN